jgi:hypothetical protein
MTSSQFNGRYRPLVKRAWEQYCQRSGTALNSKPAYQLWYQQTIHDMTGGRLHTTKGASDSDLQHLIDEFELLLSEDRLPITGWSQPQVDRFHDLAKAAWIKSGSSAPFLDWTRSVLRKHHREQFKGAYQMPDRKESFDAIMADMAVIAFDEYWICRTAQQSEIRLRYQIRRFLADLDYLDKTGHHDWDYVRGIYKQSGLLPSSIDAAPAAMLWKVLQMLDTHIRRLCDDYGIRPMDLPTRAHPHAAPLPIREGNHHIHVGHELEHCQPIHVTADEPIPF